MKKETASKEMGRPRKEIDFSELRKLCQLQATEVEICDWFDIDSNTLVARIKEKYGHTFSEYYKKNSAKGKMSLRRKQIQVALGREAEGDNPGEKPSVAMLIFLGKNYLDQSDKTGIHHSGKVRTIADLIIRADQDDDNERAEDEKQVAG